MIIEFILFTYSMVNTLFTMRWSFQWNSAMTLISSEILGLRNWFFKYRIIMKFNRPQPSTDKESQQITPYYWRCVKNTGFNMDLTLSLLPRWW